MELIEVKWRTNIRKTMPTRKRRDSSNGPTSSSLVIISSFFFILFSIKRSKNYWAVKLLLLFCCSRLLCGCPRHWHFGKFICICISILKLQDCFNRRTATVRVVQRGLFHGSQSDNKKNRKQGPRVFIGFGFSVHISLTVPRRVQGSPVRYVIWNSKQQLNKIEGLFITNKAPRQQERIEGCYAIPFQAIVSFHFISFHFVWGSCKLQLVSKDE